MVQAVHGFSNVTEKVVLLLPFAGGPIEEAFQKIRPTYFIISTNMLYEHFKLVHLM